MRSLIWRLAVALLIPFQAEATLIERDLITEDGSVVYRDAITYDTETRLEWLDLTLTTGLSVNAVRSLQSENHPLAGGWRHATHTEVCNLLGDSTGPVLGCTGSVSQTGNVWRIREVIQFLGATDESDPIFDATFGVFATDESQTQFRQAQMADGFAIVPLPLYDPNVSVPNYGHFLVRLPEVHSAVLLLLAGFALIGRRVR